MLTLIHSRGLTFIKGRLYYRASPPMGQSELQNPKLKTKIHRSSGRVRGICPTHKLAFEFQFNKRPKKPCEKSTRKCRLVYS